jgi:pSer/pThr/pTyr-binding forkhead associated (FHA) protein
MILCPNCHSSELAGSLFCSECGAQLITTGHLTTQAIYPGSGSLTGSIPDAPHIPAAPNIDLPATKGISLHLTERGEVIHLSDRTEFTIGRGVDGQSYAPDVDLSPFGAYGQGVSRIHASLKLTGQGVLITDLGSSNGTRVNGNKIVPHVDYPVNHGDVVALGKLTIQILIRK